MTETTPVLEVQDLQVIFKSRDGDVPAVDGLSFRVDASTSLGIVGESGSGKSVTSMAIMGLLPKGARVTGSIRYRGEELLGADESRLRSLRGDRIAMVFQDALTALNPVFKVGDQIGEMLDVHRDMNSKERRERVLELLDIVGIPNPLDRIDSYPHEYSGGMRQRAMIAMAIANDPDVLIADEPTTALDVTVQAQVLDVFERIQDRTRSALLLITHDLGVVAGVADRVMVMYAGRDVEQGTTDEVFYSPRHPYTRGLISSLPGLVRREQGQQLKRIKGQPPSLLHLPPGCVFWPRCEFARRGVCNTERPPRMELGPERTTACVRYGELPEFVKEESG